MEYELLPPLLGPLVGHISETEACLWLRGAGNRYGQCAGIAALYDEAGRYLENSARQVMLHGEEDFCGIVNFSGLQAGRKYMARCGVLHAGKERRTGTATTWPPPETLLDALAGLPGTQSQAVFRTWPEPGGAGIAFLLGSCRYPGLLWPASRGDRIFASMHALCQSDADIRFVLMNGDQIYADKLPDWLPLCKARTPAAFSRRYQTAFSTPGMRDLLRSMPTYMILDDHEIENDWNAGRLQHKRALFDAAMAAYRRHQWLHSPRNFSAEGAVGPGTGDQLFYSFACAGYPFFVIDSRSMRVQDDARCSLVANHMLGDPGAGSPFHSRQLELLCTWLQEQQQLHGNRPKFVVSPSTFVPNALAAAGSGEQARQAKCGDDAWDAFPATRRQLLQTIVQAGIQNVVMLCGDAHSSCVAEIHFADRLRGRLPLVMHSITASAFYWPWPFASGNPAEYVHDSISAQDGFEVNADVTMHYRAYAFERQNNFTRISVAGNMLRVQHFNRRGDALGAAAELKLHSM